MARAKPQIQQLHFADSSISQSANLQSAIKHGGKYTTGWREEEVEMLIIYGKRELTHITGNS
jgi:hypothetical protein